MHYISGKNFLWVELHGCDRHPGVIKFWGPHENGDPGSPYSLVKWGPLRENGDPFSIFVLCFIKYSQLCVGLLLGLRKLFPKFCPLFYSFIPNNFTYYSQDSHLLFSMKNQTVRPNSPSHLASAIEIALVKTIAGFSSPESEG